MHLVFDQPYCLTAPTHVRVVFLWWKFKERGLYSEDISALTIALEDKQFGSPYHRAATNLPVAV